MDSVRNKLKEKQMKEKRDKNQKKNMDAMITFSGD
jgi:hypothetical protein